MHVSGRIHDTVRWRFKRVVPNGLHALTGKNSVLRVQLSRNINVASRGNVGNVGCPPCAMESVRENGRCCVNGGAYTRSVSHCGRWRKALAGHRRGKPVAVEVSDPSTLGQGVNFKINSDFPLENAVGLTGNSELCASRSNSRKFRLINSDISRTEWGSGINFPQRVGCFMGASCHEMNLSPAR